MSKNDYLAMNVGFWDTMDCYHMAIEMKHTANRFCLSL